MTTLISCEAVKVGMRRVLGRLLTVVLLVVIAGAVGGVAAQGEAGEGPVAENATVDDALAESDGTVEVLVELSGAEQTTGVEGLQAHAAETQAPLVDVAERRDGLRVERQFWLTNAVLVTVDTGEVSLDTLAGVEGVEALRENGRVTVDTGATAATRTIAVGPGRLTDGHGVTTPVASTDVSTGNYDTTYGLAQINATAVWDTYGTRGAGTSVAVLDTGVDADHPDIDVARWAEFDSNGNQVDTTPNDGDGHGTHVSGTVTGGNASGTQIGVAPDADLYAAKVLADDGSGTFAQIIAGMEWAVDQNADLISMSLGAQGYYDSFVDPVRNAETAGVTVVASSGNSGAGTSGSPGNVYDAISVGASNASGGIAGFSSGESIDTSAAWSSPPSDWPSTYVVPSVSAPGRGVQSAWLNGSYQFLSGTSMAAPHVSGAIALMESALGSDVGPDELETALEETARKPDGYDTGTPAGERDTRYGSGIIDVPAALDSLSTGPVVELSGLDVAGAGANATVSEGSTVNVSVVVENVGDSSGSFDLSLSVGTAVEMTASTGELAAGGTETVVFGNVTGGLAEGTYPVTVSAADDSVSGEVTLEPLESVSLPDQNVTDATGVSLDGVVSDGVAALLLVTYEGDNGTVVAGVANGTYANESVTVALESNIGFPDRYTAHLLPAADASSSYRPGDTLSANTTDAVVVSETARVSTVGGAPDVEVIDGSPAKDTTGDGMLDDVRGDGELNIFDVQTLFSNIDTATVQNHSEQFNFQGANPDEVNIFDIQTLFTQIP